MASPDRDQPFGFTSRFAETRVLCLGDVMLDRFVYGDVERICPESPVPVVHARRTECMPGGAANTASNALSLGAQVHLIGVTGPDGRARELAELLGALGKGLHPNLVETAGRDTTTKTRYVAQGQQLLRCDYEDASPLDEEAERRVIAAAEAAIADADVVILSDYAKGVCTPTVTKALIGRCRELGVPVVVDPKGADVGRYVGATVVTPNLGELSVIAGDRIREYDRLIETARDVTTQHRIENLLVTRGADGMTLVRAEGEPSNFPAQARAVYDVSGAGDTVVAALATALGAGASIDEAARFANTAAGLVVEKLGTATVTVNEIVAWQEARSPQAGKVFSHDQAAVVAEGWRASGLSVGFTNGCFDLLHPGHLHVLQAAAAECDRLIVGLNSDASVRRLKGETRPVQSEQARATVLGALECVHGVVVFEEDTPLEVVTRLQPDVIVKGGDYQPEDVVGADVVQARGGRVVIAPFADGYSTTSTIASLTS